MNGMETTYTVRVAIPVPRGPGRPNATMRTVTVKVTAEDSWTGYGKASVEGFNQATAGMESERLEKAYVSGVAPTPSVA